MSKASNLENTIEQFEKISRLVAEAQKTLIDLRLPESASHYALWMRLAESHYWCNWMLEQAQPPIDF